MSRDSHGHQQSRGQYQERPHNEIGDGRLSHVYPWLRSDAEDIDSGRRRLLSTA